MYVLCMRDRSRLRGMGDVFWRLLAEGSRGTHATLADPMNDSRFGR